MTRINILPPLVADMIAAGEVVERPASVIKELMENSFDAGASKVTVEFKSGGATYIKITDDAGIAFTRHATSKLHDEKGLEAIGTMGFRGEALAAIAAVSRIELITREKGAAEGVRVVVQAGDIIDMSPIGCPEGTSITVRNIFHNTPARYRQLEDAIAHNEAGRLGSVTAEIEFCRQYEREVHALLDAMEAGKIPLRVTHNDTKLNNVLLDRQTGRGVCVIDLDTVMPGLMGHDFGDAIRFAANFVAEDSKEYDKVGIDLAVFTAFAQGFLEKLGTAMTQNELDTLAQSCFCLTAELAVRFLDDYLRGDLYFKTSYPAHNLVRARNQIALCRSMEAHMDEMNEIIHRCAEV